MSCQSNKGPFVQSTCLSGGNYTDVNPASSQEQTVTGFVPLNSGVGERCENQLESKKDHQCDG